MNLDLLSKIIGVLGFVISLLTFFITRYEKRKRIEIELSYANEFEFAKNDEENINDNSLIRVRFTNIGPTAIILKPRTLIIKHENKLFKLQNDDFYGMNDFTELVPPLSTREIGVYLDSVMDILDIKAPKTYDAKSLEKRYRLYVEVSDHVGKKFKTNKFYYHEAIGEFCT
ncbi:hypothetical protein [uncultured Tolumonas sp.]|uniref:hypothetical protein n=1 Tax=uncultured Tolumonas sp. TaxID=263765 RepID=UPI002A0A750F|nr:hypothetical protein [uncultured Tolumonas sp.]